MMVNLPIALRKDVLSSTQHHTCKFISVEKLSHAYRVFVSRLDQVQIPPIIEVALQDPSRKAAAFEEIRALEKNNTWILMELPHGNRIVGCKWIFSVKHKADGSIERFKSRLVTNEYMQSYDIDYQETFDVVARLNTIRVLLPIVANLDWPLYQLDVKNVFLNGDLEEKC